LIKGGTLFYPGGEDGSMKGLTVPIRKQKGYRKKARQRWGVEKKEEIPA